MPDFDEYNEWRAANNLPPLMRNYKRKVRAFALSDEAYYGLRHICEQYRIMRGRHISVSLLLELIGNGQYIVTPNKPRH